jgi:hypothetical protein
VHPGLLDCYLNGAISEHLKQRLKRAEQTSAAQDHGLREEELGLIRLLEQTLARSAKK